ncbi:tudor domain-containing protein 1 [Zeugodacus cucurbitae]|uniref:tudor domain-containing protein 1 n=1 Tax=Zeugodacus cucurbitae TaxID=28588 RepID=UPI0023D902B7|nr:tudor domain-containing protein 1 [Zeugodacus cucurbitae]
MCTKLMASRTNVDRMQIMYNMCKREVVQLQANLGRFLEGCEVIMRHDVFKHFQNDSGQLTHANVFALMSYDKYMSRVAAVNNLARKFNIHLQLHNINKILAGDVGIGLETVPYLLEEFVEWHKVLSDKNESLDYNVDWRHYHSVEEEKWTSYRSIDKEKSPLTAIALLDDSEKVHATNVVGDGKNAAKRKIKFAEPESLTLESLPSCVHLRDLSAFTAGYHFSAFVTYIDNIEELCFYACQMRNDLLYDLSNMYNLPKSVRIPSTNVIFGISINGKNILRGVLQSPDKKNEDNLHVLLIDYGELVPLNINDVQFYDLPKVYKELPAQAMKCTLLGVKETTDDCKEKETHAYVLSKMLLKYEFKEVNLEVVRQVGRVLQVYIIESRVILKKSPDVKKPLKMSKNPFVNSFEADAFDDDSQQEENKYFEKCVLKTRIDDVHKNDIIYLEVMHIAQPNMFYAQILNERNEQLKQLFWNTNELSVEQKLTEAPQIGDLILAQYAKDHFWYRAKVIAVEGDTKFKVFYVDYGNIDMVSLESMAKCKIFQVEEPFRAVLCRFAGINDITNGDVVLFEKAVQMLVVILLNQRIEVQIIEKINAEELCIHLLDKEFVETTQMLVDLGYAKKVEEI